MLIPLFLLRFFSSEPLDDDLDANQAESNFKKTNFQLFFMESTQVFKTYRQQFHLLLKHLKS